MIEIIDKTGNIDVNNHCCQLACHYTISFGSAAFKRVHPAGGLTGAEEIECNKTSSNKRAKNDDIVNMEDNRNVKCAGNYSLASQHVSSN